MKTEMFQNQSLSSTDAYGSIDFRDEFEDYVDPEWESDNWKGGFQKIKKQRPLEGQPQKHKEKDKKDKNDYSALRDRKRNYE